MAKSKALQPPKPSARRPSEAEARALVVEAAEKAAAEYAVPASRLAEIRANLVAADAARREAFAETFRLLQARFCIEQSIAAKIQRLDGEYDTAVVSDRFHFGALAALEFLRGETVRIPDGAMLPPGVHNLAIELGVPLGR